MKNTLIRIAMLGAIATLPLAATAAMQTDEAEAAVNTMLGEGTSAPEIIEALVEDGLSLDEATKTAVKASSGDNQIDLARAGICASSDTTQAEQVGAAALTVAGEGSLANKIKAAVEGFETGLCASYVKKEKVAPSRYDSDNSALSDGGGVSPST